jgi:hypothetical protein
MEETKEVKTIRVDYKCPMCDNGYLRPTGQCFPTNPPQYPHKCNGTRSGCDCYHGETFSKMYPYIDYK